MKQLLNLFKTERETIIFNYSDFTKIAPTVPLCNGQLSSRLRINGQDPNSGPI